MAYASETYANQTGSTTSYTVPFGYIDQSDISVTVDGVSTSFTWLNSTTIEISPAPVGDVVISRSTDVTSKVSVFVDGSAFLAAETNKQNDQLLYAVQEASDNSASSAVDAAAAAASAAAAALSEDAAYVSEVNAAASEANAATSETNAAASEAACQGLIDALGDVLVYQGTWDASTDTPALPAASTANNGDLYRVSVAGTTNKDGITEWAVGDKIVSNGTTWEKWDNTEDPQTLKGDQAQTFSKQKNFAGSSSVPGATYDWNLDTDQTKGLVPAADLAINNPTNQVFMGTYALLIDNSGAHTITWGTAFKWAGGTAPTVSGVSVISFLSDGTNMYGVSVEDFG